MKHHNNLIILLFLILSGCGSGDSLEIPETAEEPQNQHSDDTLENPETAEEYIVSNISPLRAKIGDTIKLTGTNLSKLKEILFLHEDREYSKDTITVGSYSFITKKENEITLKIPEVFHEKMLVEFPNTNNFQLEIIGMIPIINDFEHVSQIQIMDENTAYLKFNGKIYKSTDGFYKWETFYEPPNGYSISCFYYLDENNCWVGVHGNSVATDGIFIFYSENGGVDFNLRFKVSNISSENGINNIKFTSLSKGFFVDSNQKMYVTDNNTFENIYDYYPDLNSLPFGQIEIYNFNAINDDLIFLAPNGDPYLIRIDNQNASYFEFDIWPSPPLLFDNIGYVQANSDIYKTTDLGSTWSKVKTFENYYPRIQFLNDQMGFAFVNYSPAEMHLTKDGGSTWEKYYTFPRYHDAHHKGFTETNGLMASVNGRLWKYRKE